MTPTSKENTGQRGISCVVIREADEVDQCVMYPSHSTDDEIKEIYIIAEGDGFISLEDIR